MSDARELHDAAFNLSVVGPFEEFRVIINGWTVPHLSARRHRTRDLVEISVDGRLAIDVPSALAPMLLSFIADCIAVAKGWSCHPRSQEWDPHEWRGQDGARRSLPWTRMSNLVATGLEAEGGEHGDV